MHPAEEVRDGGIVQAIIAEQCARDVPTDRDGGLYEIAIRFKELGIAKSVSIRALNQIAKEWKHPVSIDALAKMMRGGEAEVWPDLEPADKPMVPPSCDLAAMLPQDVPGLTALVTSVSDSLQVPNELALSAALGLAALAVSRSCEVQCGPGWREPAPLWLLPLLRPGERKSACMGMLAAPMQEWTAHQRQALAEPLARYHERRRGLEARLTALRNRAAKEPSPDKRRKLDEEARDHAAELEAMPAGLAAPGLLVQSFTPEGMRDALEANGEKVGIVSAEADAAELMGSRYTDAPNIDLLLCAHAGDSVSTRRAGGRSIHLARPAIGLVLAVQPAAVQAVLRDRAAQGRGLVDRMLLIQPQSRLGLRSIDPRPADPDALAWWASAIQAMLDLPWPGRVIIGCDGEPQRCTTPPRILTLDDDAQARLRALRVALEPRMAEGADLSTLSGFASKLPGACARIALAFTLLRNPQAEVIGDEAMRAACAWADFLLAHHRAVLGSAVEPPEQHHARRLRAALQRRGRPVMTARDLFKLVHDSALPDMKAFHPVLSLLMDSHAIRPAHDAVDGPGRRPDRYQIHPRILPGNVGHIGQN